MRFFRDPSIQRALLLIIVLYLVTLVVSLLLHNTVLLAVAILAYVIAPFILSYSLARKSTIPRSIERQFADMFFWLLSTVILLTLILYIVTDIWNPDHFVYTLGVPPLSMKLLLLLGLQLPWICASVPLGFIPLLFRKKPATATAA